jgi:hypothetical protein
MVKEDQVHKATSTPTGGAGDEGRTPARRVASRLAALALVALPILAATWLFLALRPRDGSAGDGDDAPAAPPAREAPRPFDSWPVNKQPDFVLLLSGQEFGYLQPCGCSRPQLGGLERRYNFIQTLKKRGWPVVAVDLGDIAQERGPQALVKYRVSMQALDFMGYTGVGIGLNEARRPLIDTLAYYAVNKNKPRVLGANIADPKGDRFPTMIGSFEFAGGAGKVPKVGVTSIIGPSVAKEVRGEEQNPKVEFEDNRKVVPAVLQKMTAQKAEFLVLLYQGSLDDAKKAAKAFPAFDVVLCLSREEEPSDRADREGKTMIVGVGHKGRYVGVVGAYRTDQKDRLFELRYQLVALGEEYETPEGQDESNPILKLLENYSLEVKNGNYLAQYPQRKHPLQITFPKAKYVGSQACKSCHKHAFEVWQNSAHSHAFRDLETAKRPSNRQYDGECVVCHVVGFGYDTGYRDEKQTPKLKDVGCESCHGPGSLHAVDKDQSPEMLAAMNPFKTQPNETEPVAKTRVNNLDKACQTCHDPDNDVHWDIKKWQKIIHNEPKN